MLKFEKEICPVCGKEFFKNAQSIYKLQYRRDRYRMCSYTCYKKIKDLRKQRKYEEIDKILGRL